MIKAELIDSMGSDLTTVNAARVSFNKKSEWVVSEHWGATGESLSQKDKKLVKYLADHGHYSPFGHCFASFHCAAPIFVARQLVKHKFLRWNEVSRRYVSDEPEIYQPTLRKAVANKKQGSGDPIEPDSRAHQIVKHCGNTAVQDYNLLLRLGLCEEQARMVLPQNAMTEWYWSGSLDAFADMCNLRCKEDTQAESRELAMQISKEMWQIFPESWFALTGRGWNAQL